MAVSFAHFVFLFIITGFLIRYVEVTWPDKQFAKALMFIY